MREQKKALRGGGYFVSDPSAAAPPRLPLHCLHCRFDFFRQAIVFGILTQPGATLATSADRAVRAGPISPADLTVAPRASRKPWGPQWY